MPDTMLQTETPAASASCGVMDRYRSSSIGKLVAARAKASAKIKAIVKDKQAKVESRKEGGRSYSYNYADLADVLEAVEEAISEQGLAIFQTNQDRGRDGTYLITTLAHESDQWVAGEIRLKNADQGPQVYGSEMTYLRRYAVLAALALAPEADDDGKAAQDRADQTRHKPAQRVEPPRRTDAAPKSSQTTERLSVELAAPVHTPIVGANVGQWLSDAWDLLSECPVEWRREWLSLHGAELAVVRAKRADWAENIMALADGEEGAGHERPQHIAIPADFGGLCIGDWIVLANAAIDGKSEGWRRRWLEIHHAELADLRRLRPDWADKFVTAATAPES